MEHGFGIYGTRILGIRHGFGFLDLWNTDLGFYGTRIKRIGHGFHEIKIKKIRV
jgi:hypothetical protein